MKYDYQFFAEYIKILKIKLLFLTAPLIMEFGNLSKLVYFVFLGMNFERYVEMNNL